MSGVENLVLRQCVWYRSPSLVEGNSMRDKCYSCNSYDLRCPYYVSKQRYVEVKTLLCDKINSRNV